MYPVLHSRHPTPTPGCSAGDPPPGLITHYDITLILGLFLAKFTRAPTEILYESKLG